MRALIVAALACVVSLAGMAQAETVSFSGWKTQRFSLLSSVDFSLGGNRLTFDANDAASLAYGSLPASAHGATRATWSWAVSQSVPATDLTRKGGDDRNAALYFVFVPEAKVGAIGSVRSLINDQDARVLVYVWGGSHSRGQALSSPYLGSRGKTIVLRGAGTGQHSESVDLAADYARAFGGAPGALVGIAVSSDSDDTNSRAVGQISGLSVN